MENNTKKVGAGSSSSSSSSITLDLFGPKDSSSSSSSTTTGRFGSVFPPPSTVLRGETGSLRQLGKHGTPGYNTENKKWESNGMTSKDKSSVYQNQTVDHPCYFSSSIYYGGQEVYSPQTSRPAQSHPVVNFKKDGGEDDQNGSNSNSASRGNWWQGSLYY